MPKTPTKNQQGEISAGVAKLVRGYEKTGTIKTSRATYHPTSKQAAQRQAAAIEYGKHHVGRAGSKRK